ncbi:MAG: hypothetical protein ACK4EY_14545 [Flavipsychrobacter sp.]
MQTEYTCSNCKEKTPVAAMQATRTTKRDYYSYRDHCPKCKAELFVVVSVDGTIKTAVINFS